MGFKMCVHQDRFHQCVCASDVQHSGRVWDGYEDFGACSHCDGTGCSAGCEDCDELSDEEDSQQDAG